MSCTHDNLNPKPPCLQGELLLLYKAIGGIIMFMNVYLFLEFVEKMWVKYLFWPNY